MDTAATQRSDATPAEPLIHARLDLPGIRHGFFTRAGGVSTGLYASLNCGIGSNDDRANVFANRARAMAAIGMSPESLATPYQIHSDVALVVTEPWETGNRPKADAVVTQRPGIAVGVGSADCGPTLFADAAAGVVAAAHSGWRGALAGILESTVATMERLGARREAIVAVLGPTISAANYEVGPDLVDAFETADRDNGRFFRPASRAGHHMFDLPAYIVSRLEAAGVTAIDLGRCTYAEDVSFFSYRRSTHRREPDYGRLLSAIALGDRE
jgi:YfiH family protein